MTKSENTKKALLISIISLILCFAMLIGSTFAWFTDSVTGGPNKIVAGNLQVGVEYKKPGMSEFVDLTDDDSIFDKDALWEPGHVEVAVMKIANKGDMALAYQCMLAEGAKVIGKTADDKDIDLTNYINFAVINIAKQTDNDVKGKLNNIMAKSGDYRADTYELLNAENKDEISIPLSQKPYFEGYLESKAESDEIMVIAYMPTTVGNEANYRGETKPSIELGITIEAKQYTFEEDSFDNQYDKDATYKKSLTGTKIEFKPVTLDPWGDGGSTNITI